VQRFFRRTPLVYRLDHIPTQARIQSMDGSVSLIEKMYDGCVLQYQRIGNQRAMTRFRLVFSARYFGNAIFSEADQLSEPDLEFLTIHVIGKSPKTVVVN
jgi:hypothetical protein